MRTELERFTDDIKKVRRELGGFDFAASDQRLAEHLLAMGYKKPQPLAWDDNRNRSYEPVETLAKQIYDDFEYDGPPGTKKPRWENGANGLKHDQARAIARDILRGKKHSSTPIWDAATPEQRQRYRFMGFDPDNPDVPLD